MTEHRDLGFSARDRGKSARPERASGTAGAATSEQGPRTITAEVCVAAPMVRERGCLRPSWWGSPLAGRPYGLRHSALSTWLNAGVDPTEVAERAGNSVEVLLARYAKCLYGRSEVANQRIEGLLVEYR